MEIQKIPTIKGLNPSSNEGSLQFFSKEMSIKAVQLLCLSLYQTSPVLFSTWDHIHFEYDDGVQS